MVRRTFNFAANAPRNLDPMKHIPLLLAFFATTHLALAQPNVKPQPEIKPQVEAKPQADEDKDDERLTDKGHLSGMALIGSFYNALQHAQTFKGHMIVNITVTKNGQTTESKDMDWSSTSVSDAQGRIQKSRTQVSYTKTANGQTTTNGATLVDDGQTTRSFLPARNVWSQDPQDKSDFDLPRKSVALLWSTALAAFEEGATFKVEERQSKTGTALLAVTTVDKDATGAGMLEAVFDKQSGMLQSWTVQGDEGGEKTEMRFSDIELDKPIAPETFVLSIPANAKQVAAKETDFDLDF